MVGVRSKINGGNMVKKYHSIFCITCCGESTCYDAINCCYYNKEGMIIPDIIELKEFYEYLKEVFKTIPTYVSIEVYDEFLETLPPLIHTGGGFLTSEPYTQNAEGKNMYLGFFYNTGSPIYAGILTTKEFKEKLRKVDEFLGGKNE